MKTLEEKIIEILESVKFRSDCVTHEKISKEIASMMKEFIEWLLRQVKFHFNPKTKKWIDQTLITSQPEVTLDEIFDYFINNIKK